MNAVIERLETKKINKIENTEFFLNKIIDNIDNSIKCSKLIMNNEILYLLSMAIISAKEQLLLLNYEMS